jgi:2-polyprenyl-3-methyl-5-hydroxy-6-metoxy-1,4-benzoquinol methylase
MGLTHTQMKPEVTPEGIFRALNAFQVSSALVGAIELDLFTAIDEGLTDAAALAGRCKASERGCRILCDFLTVQGLLGKSDGRWELSPEAKVFLSRRSPAYMGGAVQFLNDPEVVDYYRDIAGVVRKGGEIVSAEGTVEPENPLWVKFARGMQSMMAGAAREIAGVLGATGISTSKVLDIAAGHGLFGIEIAKANPGAQIVALDWAAVLEVAKENAAREGVAGRYATLKGSAFEVPFGFDYDVVLMTNFLHHFDRETCVGLLRKVREALKPGGVAVTLEFVPNEDRVTPPISAAFSMIMLATTRAGDAYTLLRTEFHVLGGGIRFQRITATALFATATGDQ